MMSLASRVGKFIGRTDRTSAVMPDTIGADIDVPDHIPYRPPGIALTISSPGATVRTHLSLGGSTAFAIVENVESRSARELEPTLRTLSSVRLRSAAG